MPNVKREFLTFREESVLRSLELANLALNRELGEQAFAMTALAAKRFIELFILPAVVRVIPIDGQTNYGTAFFIGTDKLLSAYHVFKSPGNEYLILMNEPPFERLVRVIEADVRTDLALLEIVRAPGSKFKLSLSETGMLEFGLPVMAYGYRTLDNALDGMLAQALGIVTQPFVQVNSLEPNPEIWIPNQFRQPNPVSLFAYSGGRRWNLWWTRS